MLKTFTSLVQKQLRVSDVFFRLGGEEFIAVLPGADAAVAFAVAERLRTGVEATPLNFPTVARSRSATSLEIAMLEGEAMPCSSW